MPFLVRYSATLLAPNLVRVNTSTCDQSCSLITCASSSFFLPRPTGWTTWVMRCTVVLRGVTWMLCGFFSSVCGQVADLVAEGGREQQALLFLGHQRQDLLHVGQEAHVQHAVGFVEHQDLDGGQVQVALLLQVEQAARRGHQDVDAAA